MYKLCAMPFGRRKPMKGDMGQDLSVPLFTKYSEHGKMGVPEFLRFLQEEQGESTLGLEDAKQILQQNLKENGSKFKLGSSNSMTKDEFCAYLLCPKLNGVLPKDVYQDMTQPLSHYFIFTGHNSYLTGNQLSSDSSEEPIKAALQRGVRVVELDLWPDDQGGVKVTHGNTLTKPVDFKKCIIAIRDNAFINSQYPVCVTLEDHLTCDLQAKAAEILTEILGDTLYYPKTSDALSEFPSPESLKGRIIISTKPPKEQLEADAVAKAALKDEALLQELQKEDAQEESSTVLIKEGSAGHRVGNVPVNVSESVPATALPEPASPSPTAEECESDEDDSKKNPVYARLITIRQAKPGKGTSMKDRLKVEETVKRISLAESKLKAVAEEFPDLLVKFTQRNVLRIYPDGSRVNSSNYNPIGAWNHGAQMVAQNMQGYGKELWQAHGKFRGNGGCGFILKPKCLLENSPEGKPFNPLEHKSTKIRFKVKVMMTQGWDKAFSKRHFDLFSPPDFFTRVLVSGVPADVAKWKTSVVDNQWVPYWNEEHEFSLRLPELALLRLEVRDYDEESKDEFEGQACLPIHEIREGYRCVQMYDKKGNELKEVKMLIHFQKLVLSKDPVPPTAQIYTK